MSAAVSAAVREATVAAPADGWDHEVDVLVLGSGAGGMTAALVAAQHGLRVMLCEKAARLGGTTAISGGELWIPGNEHARAAGELRDPADALRYWEAEAASPVNAAHRRAYLETAAEAIAWLERHSALRFRSVAPHPDYHLDQPGASLGGRPLGTLAFDGRRLGRQDFELLRPPRKDFMVFGGMMVSRDDIAMLLRPLRSPQAFWGSARLVGRYLRDRLGHSRGTRLVLGNALVARLLLSLRERQVDIRTGTALRQLLRGDDGSIEGAVVDAGGSALRVRARGIVLATGGFASSAAMRRSHMQGLPVEHALSAEGNVGDALAAACGIGAQMQADVVTPAYWMPSSLLRQRDGTVSVFPHIRDRAKPGVILVDSRGHRFVNESASYHDVSLAMFAQHAKGIALPAWLVCDRRFIRDHGIGMIQPVWQRLGPFERAGYLVRGKTLAELAARIGVDAAALEDAVGRHNASAATGVDADFGKGSTAYNRHYGDPDHRPNPCLRPIEQAPFFAVAVRPAPIGTTVGLRTDPNGNVLDTSGQPIPGLYACGNDMASVTRGAYPGPGSTLGPAMVFAWRAMRHFAAGQAAEGADSARLQVP